MKFNSLILVSLLIIFAGCEKIRISKIPTNVKIDDHSLVLEASVARDFQPGISTTSMISINRLVDQNRNDILSRFELEEQIVVKANEVWESNYTNEIRDTENNVIERVSRDGPNWKTGKKVNVICEFKDNLTGENFQIMVKNETIRRFD